MVRSQAIMGWVFLLAIFALHLSVCVQSQAVPDKPYSYMCLSAEQKLCLGISTTGAPVTNGSVIYRLQVKPREKNEQRGVDWMKTRWSVFRSQGTIQLANFTTMCIAKEVSLPATPGNVVLRECGKNKDLQEWALEAFNTNQLEQATIRLRSRPDQCLTLMNCERGTTPSTDYCNPDVTTQFSGRTYDAEKQRGSHVKLMPCTEGNNNQIFRQTIDCAPGCSPFMMVGPNNECDKECANDACNFDNMACGTPKPTPPTQRPTGSPTGSPTTSKPSRSPSRTPSSAPSHTPTSSPTTSRPSKAPTTSRPTGSPSSTPSKRPSTTPSRSPSRAPSRTPSKSPTTSRPSWSPSSSPSRSPSRTPSFSPTETPSRAPTTSPSLSPTANATSALREQNNGDPLLWLWILIGVLLFLLLLCCIGGVLYKRKKDREEKEKDNNGSDKSPKKHSASDVDIESPPRRPTKGVQGPEDEDSMNVIFLSNNSNVPPKVEATPPEVSSKETIPIVPPLGSPTSQHPESDNFLIKDNADSQGLMFPDAAMTPRSAAAQRALSPDPTKKPKGGAPGLAWSGSQGGSARNEMLFQHSLRTEEQLPGALQTRSFKMPKEVVNEGPAPSST